MENPTLSRTVSHKFRTAKATGKIVFSPTRLEIIYCNGVPVSVVFFLRDKATGFICIVLICLLLFSSSTFPSTSSSYCYPVSPKDSLSNSASVKVSKSDSGHTPIVSTPLLPCSLQKAPSLPAHSSCFLPTAFFYSSGNIEQETQPFPRSSTFSPNPAHSPKSTQSQT